MFCSAVSCVTGKFVLILLDWRHVVCSLSWEILEKLEKKKTGTQTGKFYNMYSHSFKEKGRYWLQQSWFFGATYIMSITSLFTWLTGHLTVQTWPTGCTACIGDKTETTSITSYTASQKAMVILLTNFRLFFHSKRKYCTDIHCSNELILIKSNPALRTSSFNRKLHFIYLQL